MRSFVIVELVGFCMVSCVLFGSAKAGGGRERWNNANDKYIGAPFQWAAIFHKEDINFTHGHHDLGWYA